MKIKRTVLLTNDDGYDAPGIRYLYDVLSPLYKVVVVAPNGEQSGIGHAFTFNKPLHYEKIPDVYKMQGYIVHGTPADCVKFTISYILPQRPDLVVSGMNIGENSGLSAFYSGTVAGAREGAFWNIPSFAFSVCKEGAESAVNYASMVPSLLEKITELEKNGAPERSKVYYNINFPPCSHEKVRGLRATWQSLAFFDDRYERIEVESHHTKEGFLIYGEKKDIEISGAYDSRALMDNYISITPLSFDATALSIVPNLQMIERLEENDRG